MWRLGVLVIGGFLVRLWVGERAHILPTFCPHLPVFNRVEAGLKVADLCGS